LVDDFVGWVTRLVHEHRARLAGVARREGLAAEDALDCVQEAFQTFLGLPRARALVDSADDSAALLTVLARNAARNRRRRRWLAAPHVRDDATLDGIPDDGRSAEELLAGAAEVARLHGCVAGLGELQRKVVALRLLDEVAGEDVAQALGLSPGHVAVLLHRAKAQLRHCMICGGEHDERD
jgi:RNA polymerase sigma-70 factor (ECF subfamily)